MESPSVAARIGHGATDVWEPLKQGYLNLTDTQRAQAYGKQRAEDERPWVPGMIGPRVREPGRC